MIQRLVRAAAPLLLALSFIGPVRAQDTGEPPPAQSAATGEPEKGKSNPGPSMVLAFLCTILILFIICRPARKF
jgi:hypothetical protein